MTKGGALARLVCLEFLPQKDRQIGQVLFLLLFTSLVWLRAGAASQRSRCELVVPPVTGMSSHCDFVGRVIRWLLTLWRCGRRGQSGENRESRFWM